MTQPSPRSPVVTLLERVRAELGDPPDAAAIAVTPARPVPLPSRLSTADLAWASVRAASTMAGVRHPPDPDRIAAAYRSDRLLTVDGIAPDVWSPYSGFWRSADGWVRTHGNYPHHSARLLSGLGLSPARSTDELEAAFRSRTTAEAVDDITGAGGLAAPVRPENPRRDAQLRATALLDIERLDARADDGRAGRGSLAPLAGQPLTGVRVLDLTRVIAGPVCTRTLALLGADVLRVDPPQLGEPGWQHLDTGHGKRTTLLDARSERFRELVDRADVVVLGYRPGSLDRLGLSASALADRRPGLVIAQLCAWGFDEPHRAGFDSLVQAESGIALIESPDGDRPGALPAQALDHSAGYLLAASVIALLDRRAREGGTWRVRTSLRRVAAELLGMPRRGEPAAERELDVVAHTTSFDVGGHRVTTARPVIPGLVFSAPHAWGSDQPRW